MKPQGYLTRSFNAFPALNLGTFFPGICIFLPVAGLTPVRAFLFITEKVPNPVKTTVLLPFKAPPTADIIASRQSLHCDFGSLVILAICSTNFALFIYTYSNLMQPISNKAELC